MDKNQLVQIFVPTCDGAGCGEIATGYPVGPDRILTARHALYPATRDDTRCIEVRWYHLADEAREWRPVQEIVWDGGADCDAALIAVSSPAGVRPALLSANQPVTGIPWESEGFARAGRKDECRLPVGLKGQMYGMANAGSTFELGVDDPTSMPAGWKGASGSPVFSGGAIHGIVVTCPENFENRRLRATPCWRLMEDEGFRRQLGIDIRAARLDAYHNTITATLRRSTAVVQDLADEFQIAGPPAERAAAVAKAMTGLMPQQALETLDALHCRYWEGGEQACARTAKEIAFLVLPAVFDEGIVEGVRSWEAQRQGALIDVPVGTRTIAEVVMAGHDRRPLQYRPFVDGQDLDGHLRLPHAPEEGIDCDCRRFQEAFGMHLSQLLLAGNVQDLHNAFHDYMTGSSHLVTDTQRNRGLTQGTLIQLAASRLRDKARRKQTHYFVFELPANTPPEVHQRFRTVLTELKKQYDAIVFLSLSRDEPLIVREHEVLINSLAELHKRQPSDEGRT